MQLRIKLRGSESMNKNMNKEQMQNILNSRVHQEEIDKRLIAASTLETAKVYEMLGSREEGLTDKEVEISREQYGENKLTYHKKDSVFKRIIDAFVNPFTLILIFLAVVSIFTDVILIDQGEKDYTTVVIIVTMVMISGILKFIQETRSGNAAEKLLEMVETTTGVERKDLGTLEIDLDEVVVGDIVHLSAGDMIPADVRILKAKDMFISQSSLTGESEPVEKYSDLLSEDREILDRENLAFMGTNVVSGYAEAIVVSVGDQTVFGQIAKDINKDPVVTSFEKGVNAVSSVLIRYMVIMVPIVFLINGITKKDWMSALLFAISIAVGLTPEMLPMIVTASLAKGSVAMSKKKVIVKNLNSIQNLGAIDILFTDKTGTLTEDKVRLQQNLDIEGNASEEVLKYGFFNSYFQTGLSNLLDEAIIDKYMEVIGEKDLDYMLTDYVKVDEVPFDFNRRRLSVVVEDHKGRVEMITKGAVEEMLSISNKAQYKGEILDLDQDLKDKVLKKVNELNNLGMRVIAVSKKTNPSPVGQFSIADESEMTLIGYLAFLDPPKSSTKEAIEALNRSGVDVKILTGDNEFVTKNVCKQVGIDFNKIYLGSDVDKLDDEELGKLALTANVFAKMSPSQKARVIRATRGQGHSVGYMGDGINDAAALEACDVGISVNNAVDIAKESSDVILLEKDLMILEDGILEGRKTYANMIKYIKMTASSNFGNVFSVLIASAFLPFLPMESIHLLLLNLIYDISVTAIPWDNVDEEYLDKPREWDASSVSKFMIWIGPISSIFDITTYLLMYFVIAPMFTGGLLYTQLTDPAMKAMYIAIFQAGWFVESMWSQTLVIHMIRTPKVPFIESRASLSLTVLTFAGIILATLIPYTGFGNSMGLAPLPKIYFLYLTITIVAYMILAQIIKNRYVKRYGELL